ncbi:HET-domain-containing protein [Colletotrichum eremochloae]|nr:HET-domain-containing protein [Colletotrichum eremochloae]
MLCQNPNTFPYSPLDPAQREIRLIRFADLCNQNRQTETIRLELQHASLNSDISYAALSYVWGDPSNKATVHINGEPMHVTRNLYDALQQLGQNGVTSWLWIDAICISQSDLEEKRCQVDIMGDVFGSADLVYMWLGPGCEGSNMVMDMISRFGARLHAAGAFELSAHRCRASKARRYVESRLHSDSTHVQDVSELDLAVYDLSCNFASGSPVMRDGLRNVLQRDYWHRVWIIQEVVLARRLCVMIGTRKVLLEEFQATLEALWWCRGLNRPDDPAWKGLFYGLSGTSYPPQAIKARSYRQAGSAIRLEEFLWEYGAAPDRPHYTATDPRDIILGLLGLLANENKQGLHADYEVSFADIFTRFTRSLIENSSESAYFRLDCVNPGDPNGQLPTWVPDWRDIGKYGVETYPIHFDCLYRASGGKSEQIKAPHGAVQGNSHCLRRSGCLVDEIIEVMPPPKWIQESRNDPFYLQDPDKWFFSIAAFMRLGKDSGPGEDYIWKTVGCDKFVRDVHTWIIEPGVKAEFRMTEGLAWLCRRIMRLETLDPTKLTEEQDGFIRTFLGRWFKEPISEETLAEQVKRFAMTMRNSLGCTNRNRTLFKTAKGMLGLGHVGVEVGDIVTLIWEVPSPIILRPRNEGTYYFRGDAYVDGIMYGEFLANEPKETDFDIY